MADQFDVVVIGSGLGGLATASLLAQFGNKRVLVLERHFKAGGFTHTFRRQNWHWDVGLHYVGEVGEGEGLRPLFDVVTGQGVKWQAMPSPFEVFVYPQHRLEVPADPQAYQDSLCQAFPHEQRAIAQYFKDIQRVSRWSQQFFTSLVPPAPIGKAMRWFNRKESSFALQTTASYIHHHFRDPELRGVLVSQWGDYGLPPSKSAFLIHAIVARHYLYGGYYPIGGSGTIAESVTPILTAHGGEVRVYQEVTEILLEKGRAVGVRVRDRRPGQDLQTYDINAPVVISDAGVWNTYLKLLSPAVVPFRAGIESFFAVNPSVSAITLYLGFNQSPQSLGFKGENHWIYPDYDHERNFARRHQWLHTEAPLPVGYVSFPSLKDAAAQSHTGEIITLGDASDFTPWAQARWKKRGTDYEAFKQQLSEKMLDFVEQRYPGFRALVAYHELSTPLTNAWFTDHYQGRIYGAAATPDRFDLNKNPFFQTKTPIPGLYLTGADACSLGIGGVLVGGMLTALNVLPPRAMGKLWQKVGSGF